MLGEIAVFCVFLLFSAFFSASETAFTSLSVIQIQELKKGRGARGKLVVKLASRPDLFLATILIGSNVVNIWASAYATTVVIDKFSDAAVGIGTGIVTFLVLVFGEVTPKRVALSRNRAFALACAPAIYALQLALLPVVKAVNGLGTLLSRVLGSSREREEVTVEGLLHMVALAENLGLVDIYKGRMARNALRLSDATVQGIMTHRTRVFSLESGTSVDAALGAFSASGFGRAPVWRADPERIIGVASLKRVLEESLAGRGAEPVDSVMGEPLFVLQGKRVNELFVRFKRARESFAVVIDEYGGLAGVVSVRDAVEELVGEIYDGDEDEDAATGALDRIERLSGGELRLAGDTPLHLLQEFADIRIEHSPRIQTVSGYIVSALGRIPSRGEAAETDIGLFTVEAAGNNRVLTARFRPGPPAAAG